MKKYIIIISLTLLFWGCNTQNNISSNNTITQNSNFNDFKGRPSLIIFAGTYCEHCQKSIPKYKSEIWDKYKDKVNIWINVIDKKLFDVKGIPQGTNNFLTFKTVSGKDCGYIPSWVILDKNFKPVETSCGGGKSTETMKAELDKLLN